MSEQRAEKQPGGGDVTGLLQTLQQLSRRILSRLWAGRLEHDPRQGGNAGSVDISELVHEYIDQTLVEQSGQDSRSPGSEVLEAVSREDAPTAGQRTGRARATDTVGAFQELSSHLNQKRRSNAVQPQLAEQFRRRTWKHIREAASFAREGNGEAARVHAELAGRSMEEACRYMSAEEFGELRREVEESLRKKGDNS
jgi:hypothetical protein